MLKFFEEQNGSLVFRENGETIMVTPWGLSVSCGIGAADGQSLSQGICKAFL